MENNNLVDDCLFCKIIRGEIPSYTVFENDDVKAFLDISQVNPGHTLMVPNDAKQYLQYIPEIANAIKKAFPNVTAMNITTNKGKAANQVVMHSHIHFIPRFEGDGLKLMTRNNADEYDDAKYKEVAEKIKEQF